MGYCSRFFLGFKVRFWFFWGFLQFFYIFLLGLDSVGWVELGLMGVLLQGLKVLLWGWFFVLIFLA